MAIQFIEGWDCYSNVSDTSDGLQAVWQCYNGYGNLAIVSPGRFGGQAMRAHGYVYGNNGYAQHSITPTLTFSVGFATQMTQFYPGTNNYSIAFMQNSSTTSIGIGMTASQQFFVYKGNVGDGNVLCTGTTTISVGSWHYVELECSIGTSGFANLYVDGLLAASFTGNTGSVAPIACGLGLFEAQDTGHSTEHLYDDVYFTNVATRLGERRVQTLVPASDVAVQFTPSTGSTNYNLVNTLPVSAAPTANVAASVAGYQDLYGITPLANSPSTINCVQVRICAAKDNSATKTMAPVIKSGSTTQVGTTSAVTTSYLYYINLYETDPNTSGSWTASSVNALEIGQKVIS